MSASTVVSEIIPRKAADEGMPRANFAYSAARPSRDCSYRFSPSGSRGRCCVAEWADSPGRYPVRVRRRLVVGPRLAIRHLCATRFTAIHRSAETRPLDARVAVKAALRGFLGVLQLQAVATLGFDWIFLRSIPNASFQLDELNRSLKARIGFERAIYRLLGTLFTIGFSLLPLSSLLVALPMVSPTEAVLTETIRPTNSWWRRTARRALAGLAGLAVLVVLLAFAVEIVSHFPIASGGQLGTLAKKVLGYSVADFVPNDTKPSEPTDARGHAGRDRQSVTQAAGPIAAPVP